MTSQPAGPPPRLDRTVDRSADLALAQAAGRGDVEARRRLAQRLFDRVTTTVGYLTRGRGERDDIVQEALIEILRSAGGFRGEARLETWADQITTRVALRLLAKGRRRDAIVQAVEDLPEPGAAASGAADNASHRTFLLRRRLAAHLEALSADRRTAIVLHLVHGYSVEEIAQIQGAPVNTIRDRLQVGRKQLRKALLKDPSLRELMTKEGLGSGTGSGTGGGMLG